LAGNVRLVFISDAIPDGLKVIVEFLNERMTPTEVLAVEVRQYLADRDHQILQTRWDKLRARVGLRCAGGSRRQPVIGVLMEGGELTEGQELWLRPSVIPVAHRPSPDDPRLRVTLVNEEGLPFDSRTSRQARISRSTSRPQLRGVASARRSSRAFRLIGSLREWTPATAASQADRRWGSSRKPAGFGPPRAVCGRPARVVAALEHGSHGPGRQVVRRSGQRTPIPPRGTAR
jgi:hypothetical protein